MKNYVSKSLVRLNIPVINVLHIPPIIKYSFTHWNMSTLWISSQDLDHNITVSKA